MTPTWLAVLIGTGIYLTARWGWVLVAAGIHLTTAITRLFRKPT